MQAFTYLSVLLFLQGGSLVVTFLLTWLHTKLHHFRMTIQRQGQVRISEGTRRRQQVCICPYLESPCTTDHDDSSSWVRVYYYFGFWNPTEHSTIHDHHWNFFRLFMSLLQRHGDEGLRQARPMDKLQALVFHLHSHM
jgi:hypothetical protein